MTHPFHPWRGRELQALSIGQNWGEERVFFRADNGTVCSMPVSWTSIMPGDPFVLVAAGRAYFRTEDLLRLVAVVQERDASQGTGVK